MRTCWGFFAWTDFVCWGRISVVLFSKWICMFRDVLFTKLIASMPFSARVGSALIQPFAIASGTVAVFPSSVVTRATGAGVGGS